MKKKMAEIKKYLLNTNLTGLDNYYFLHAGFWTGMRQLAISCLGLLLSIILARNTSSETFGNYQIVLSLFAFLSIISLPGLAVSISRAIPQGYEGNYKESLILTFKRSLIGMLVVLIAGSVLLFVGNKELGLIVILLSILFPFQESLNLWDIFLSSKEEYKRLSIFGILASAFIVLSTLAALVIGKGSLFTILIGYMLSNAAVNMVGIWYSLKFVKNNEREQGFLEYGIFMTKISLLQMTAAYGDKIVLGIFVSPQSLAAYIISISMISSLQVAIKSVSVIITPKLVKLKLVPRRIWLLSVLLGLLISFIAYFSVGKIIELLYPNSYADAVELSRIASLSLILFVTNLVYERKLLVLKEKRVITKFNLIKYPLFWLIQFVLYMILGLEGLVIAFAMNQLIILIATLIIDKNLKLPAIVRFFQF